MTMVVTFAKSVLTPLIAVIGLVRAAPGCAGGCSGGRLPCNCGPTAVRSSAAQVTQGPARCISCGEPQGEPHIAGCWVADITTRGTY